MEEKLGLSQKIKKVNPMDELFGLNKDSEQIENIPVEMLIPYTEHKFELYTGQRKQDLIDSIREDGIIFPIIVIPATNGYYMIIAGHNRTECGKEAGLKEIPAIIKKNLSQTQIRKIVIRTNLFQRGFAELPISQQAEVIADYYYILGENVNVSDIEDEIKLSPVGTRQVAQEYSLSKNSIARLLRINMLIVELKNRVDTGEISKRAGVDLSHLSEEKQLIVEDTIKTHNIKIDTIKSTQLKILSKSGKLTDSDINLILLGKEKNKNTNEKVKQIKISTNIINKYFRNNQAQEEIQDIIELALEKYFKEKEGDIQ